MRHAFLILVLLLLGAGARAQLLYARSFGKPSGPALIFLHGGPGYNAATFESTTPQRLADSGFFVIVYDRRGEGRSPDTAARYTFDEAASDLDLIYARFGLKKATLLGHSFGGVIGTEYAESNPEKVEALLLIGAPVNMQASFRNILARCRDLYTRRGDSARLRNLESVADMDTASLAYSSSCFGLAMQNGFYVPRERSVEAKAIHTAFRADTALSRLAMQMDFRAPRGYQQRERYTTLDLRVKLRALRLKGVPIYGIYGKEDGLYAPEQVSELGRIIGADRMFYLDNASHNVFIDQQRVFIETIKKIAGRR